MKNARAVLMVLLIVPSLVGLVQQERTSGKPEKNAKEKLSFKENVFPILKKYCLPCHAEESMNPSELSLDTYELLMKGGKHGPPVEPGKPEESLLIAKLSASPPFGDPMPLNVRRQKNPSQQKKLSQDEIRTITTWIAQGAGNN